MLALGFMDTTLKGIFFLVAVVLFVIAALAGDRIPTRFGLVAAGLAFYVFPYMWDAFAAG